MSVENLLNRTPDESRVNGIIRGPEFREGHSRMRALADALSNEGHRGIVEIYDEVSRTGRTMGKSPWGLLPNQTHRYRTNAAGVLWGAIFRTAESLMIERVYDPNSFMQIFKSGFAGIPWGEAFVPASTQKHGYTSDSVSLLTLAARSNKTLSFLATEKGQILLPTAFRADIVQTGFFEPLKNDFADKYSALARAVLAAPKTDYEIIAAQPNHPDNKPLNFK